MIYIGYADDEKCNLIAGYIQRHGIERTVVISSRAEGLPIPEADQVQYRDVIMYVTFYRLLQEVTPQTLIVLDECLRTQNRYDLAYNCIRNFLNLTEHQLVFQYLPQIDTCEDFMVLFDFDTRSRWKRQPFNPELIKRESQVVIHAQTLSFQQIGVETSPQTRMRYITERERLFQNLGQKDPHTLPRTLYMVSSPDKRVYVRQHEGCYVARNQRLGSERVSSYADAAAREEPYVVVDLPHRFIDFVDFMTRTRQTSFDVLVADLKVEHWYFQRYVDWGRRLDDTANLLH